MSLLVAGSLHLDVVLKAPRLPVLDETLDGSSVDYVFGGKGGNQALAAARMGADVHFAGRAGSDSFGDMIRATLSDSSVNLVQLQRDAGPSGMSAAILNAEGDYGAVIVSAANQNLDADQIVIPKSTSLVLLQNEVPEAVNLAIARKAKDAGAQVWLNAAPARALPAALAAAVDLMIVNRVEAGFYTGQNADVQTLTTLGSEGVVFQGHHSMAYPVDVISTHGAGDMFVGALAAGVAGAEDTPQAIRFAQAAAALHVSADRRARAALCPQRVIAFMQDQDSR